MLFFAELSSSQTSSEEKLNHEAEELEKRLSMLSHGSSTGRTYCSKALSLILEMKNQTTLSQLIFHYTAISRRPYPFFNSEAFTLSDTINDKLTFNIAELGIYLSLHI